MVNNRHGIKAPRTILNAVGDTKVGKNWGEKFRQITNSLLVAIHAGRGSLRTEDFRARDLDGARTLWFIDGLSLDKSLKFIFPSDLIHKSRQTKYNESPCICPSPSFDNYHLSQTGFICHPASFPGLLVHLLLWSKKLPPDLVAYTSSTYYLMLSEGQEFGSSWCL